MTVPCTPHPHLFSSATVPISSSTALIALSPASSLSRAEAHLSRLLPRGPMLEQVHNGGYERCEAVGEVARGRQQVCGDGRDEVGEVVVDETPCLLEILEGGVILEVLTHRLGHAPGVQQEKKVLVVLE